MNVMKNIIKLLEDRRLEQKDLCDYLKISPQTFTDWKAGRRLSYTKHLDKIAEYFGVSVDYLLGNDTNKVTEHDIQVALFDDAEDSEEMWEQVKNFAKFLRENKK